MAIICCCSPGRFPGMLLDLPGCPGILALIAGLGMEELYSGPCLPPGPVLEGSIWFTAEFCKAHSPPGCWLIPLLAPFPTGTRNTAIGDHYKARERLSTPSIFRKKIKKNAQQSPYRNQ